ncbi:(deoxy)nucleoside triphosphate pyrophosphohydrolase [Nocardioides sp. BP30]|uniref:(deoxy)nucleoside triphosphate pyrophosphohydrolase n=1 Tax=Nocardioides sp. BP30 TaxID=3036374 RepID=UPI002469841B|nr:(deoxy)nucleoside triphosphate pyrophosphohydrolase [Nocardioides sp. BP30]WGL53456.1 (deoxy)nucleoside triphosphate pyrophosphohydrolase [Nocardioides sp. BP30]
MRTTVVAAAILRGDRLLACRRTAPPEAAGRWELPGGKVEAGETPEAALVREIGEELGCLVEVGEWLEATVAISETHELRAALCEVVAGEVRPREHDQIRWLGPDELDDVDWLEPDRPFIALIAGAGDGDPASLRAVFFDADDALAVEQTLLADGWSASRSRQRFQGEDDDEDHPWVVETNAPEFVVELLVDEYDGWLDVADPGADTSIAPEPLPDAPKRVKRPL